MNTMSTAERFGNYLVQFSIEGDVQRSAYECETCGAIVTNTEKHNEWHSDQGE